MKVKADAQAIFAGPLKRFERVSPRDLGQEGFSFPSIYGPKGNGQADPIETSTSYQSEILLGLHSL
jgi:hypothetical protein